MDSYYDRCLLWGHGYGSSLYNRYSHRCPDRFVQGSHCHSQCTESSTAAEIHQVAELVLVGYNHVLSLRRECDILFQAHSLG